MLGGGGLRSVLRASYMGVDFFFVISGFVLFLPTVLNDGDFGDRRSYILRRLARIGPAYYVFLLVTVVVTPLVTVGIVDLPYQSPRGAALFVSHLTFLQHTVGRLFGEPYPLLALSWTLTLEMAFYLLLPFVARSFHRHPFRWLAGALVVSTGWKLFATHAVTTLGWLGAGGWSPRKLITTQVILVTQLPSYVGHFAVGMAAAWTFVRLQRRARRLRPHVVVAVQLVAVAGVLAFMRSEGRRALTNTAGTYDPWTRTTVVAFIFAVLVLATALAPRAAQLPLANRVSRWLGDISYGIYLSQLIVIVSAAEMLGLRPTGTAGAMVRMVAIAVPGAVLAAWLSFRFVERPTRLWMMHRTRARDPLPAPASLHPEGAQAKPAQPQPA
jgi:peptidoglycan/LPS O-acetylase OafA/YrhL